MSKKDGLGYETTLEVRDSCVCLHVQRAARALARRYDEALRPAGLTHGQFSLLMSLNRPAPARFAEVTRVLAMDRTTLTANLKPLQRRGLVAVSSDPEDRRGRLLSLLPQGRAALAAALPHWRQTQEAIARLLPEDRIQPLLAALRSLS